MTIVVNGVVYARIVVEDGASVARWADGAIASLPPDILLSLPEGVLRDGELRIWSGMPPLKTATVRALRERAAFTAKRPSSSRLPISYQRVPVRLRTLIGDAVGRVRRRQSGAWARFPQWPIDLTSDLLADLADETSPIFGRPTPVLLTHDLDTPEGLRNCLDHFLPMEEGAGAKSANYIVPCGWPIDHGRLNEVLQRGHEIGIHGYDHSNLTPYAPPEERRRRLDAARPIADRYAVSGYRAPSLIRTQALLEDLRSRYRYDTSIPTSGGPFPVPNNGCASARPFRICGINEIPVSLPRDGTLRFLGYSAQEIFTVWKNCASQIAASGGVVNILTHCEKRFSGSVEMRRVYQDFIEMLAADARFQFTRPSELVDSHFHT